MNQSAQIMVLDEIPDDQDIEEIVCAHLDSMEEEEVEASIDIVYEAPDWLSTGEQDQINAHLRDGGACVLVLYITVGESAYDEDDE